MLLVPLALAVPGGAPEAGEEVVLAAGMPEGAAIDEPGGQDSGGDLIASVQVEVTDEEPTADEQAPSTRPPTKRRLSARASATPASTTPVAKLSATAARGATAPKVTKPTATTEAMAARVTTARVVEAAAAPPPSPPPASAAPAGNGDAVWDRLAVCESGNTNDPGPTYYGYWQFSAGTWTSMGEPGLPNEHSRARQLVAAKRLQAASGWGQWPDCSRRLGLQ